MYVQYIGIFLFSNFHIDSFVVYPSNLNCHIIFISIFYLSDMNVNVCVFVSVSVYLYIYIAVSNNFLAARTDMDTLAEFIDNFS